jgi:DNA-binding NtrC family response regulator
MLTFDSTRASAKEPERGIIQNHSDENGRRQHLLPPQPDQTVILVVDDEVMLQNAARITLEADGYFILTAHDGEEALHISREFPGTIHAVLSDVRMPKMDGILLRERILVERPGIPILLMSGYVDAAPPFGVPFLTKPFDPARMDQPPEYAVPLGSRATNP